MTGEGDCGCSLYVLNLRYHTLTEKHDNMNTEVVGQTKGEGKTSKSVETEKELRVTQGGYRPWVRPRLYAACKQTTE